MKLLPNMIAIILVPILLFVVLYIGPNAIVSCEWRKEQSAIENGMSTAIRVGDYSSKFHLKLLISNFHSNLYQDSQNSF